MNQKHVLIHALHSSSVVVIQDTRQGALAARENGVLAPKHQEDLPSKAKEVHGKTLRTAACMLCCLAILLQTLHNCSKDCMTAGLGRVGL